MTKKGPLSKAEKFYIENHTHLSVGDLCKDLDRAKSTIQKYTKTLPESTSNTTEASEKVTNTYNQFARNDKGSVIMTENASVMGDEHRAKKREVPPRSKRCTTRIR